MPLVTGQVLSKNRWYEVTFDYNNVDAKLYVNGVLQSTKKAVNRKLVLNSNPIYLGNNPSLTRGFVGYVDYIEIINKV